MEAKLVELLCTCGTERLAVGVLPYSLCLVFPCSKPASPLLMQHPHRRLVALLHLAPSAAFLPALSGCRSLSGGRTAASAVVVAPDSGRHYYSFGGSGSSSSRGRSTAVAPDVYPR